MELTLEILGVISGFELLLWTTPLWRIRKAGASALILALSVFTGGLMSQRLSLWVLAFCVISIYRIINLLRLVQGRSQIDFLHHASRQTAFWLIGSQVAIVIIVKFGALYHIDSRAWFYYLTTAQLTCSVVLLRTVLGQLRATRPPPLEEGIASRDLPALTVAIPARNETAALEACLQSLVASTYPKLEVLVLDDCSQNKHTPEIIRNFAHAGVRFMAGKVSPPNWIAKNYAYSQLADEANGELLLFCGVDVRFEPNTLEGIVRTLLQKKKSMLGIIPNNSLSDVKGLNRLLLQPNRYAWELALPRRLIGRPPVLSTCWIITKTALKTAGGFNAAMRKAVPESYLARSTAAQKDGYSFVQSDSRTAVSSHKSFQEQRDTAIRTRYPQLHRRLELVVLVGFVEFALLVCPFIILVVSIVLSSWALAILAGMACIINMGWYSQVVNLTYRTHSATGLCFLPFAALYDIGLLNYSMWQYEFNEVIWKGRNVCIPLMRIIPHLPETRTSEL